MASFEEFPFKYQTWANTEKTNIKNHCFYMQKLNWF